MSTDSLWPECALPGCANPADTQGHPCPSCRRDFADYLTHHPDGTAMTAAQQAERDRETRATYAAHREIDAELTRIDRTLAIAAGTEAKPGQTCCEERRHCRLIAGRWECGDCRHVR